jgi:hypothetical protein
LLNIPVNFKKHGNLHETSSVYNVTKLPPAGTYSSILNLVLKLMRRLRISVLFYCIKEITLNIYDLHF